MRIPGKPIALAVASVLAISMSACGDDGKSDSASCPDGRIRFATEPFEDPAKLTPAFEVMAKALEKKMDCPVKFQVTEDYAAEVLAMKNGKLDVATFGPLGFVFASQKAKAEPLVSFADAKGVLSTYKAGIWVKKDSPIQNVQQLKGKSLALSSVGSTSGDALPRYALRQAGIQEKEVKLNYAGGHPEALLALTKGKVEAAEINTQQQSTASSEGTFDASKFRQIWVSAPIPNDPIAVRGDMSAEFKKKVHQAFLSLSPQDVAKVGSYLDVDPPGPLITVTKDTYKPLFDLATTLGLSEKDVK